LPAASGPSCPLKSTTRVDATFKLSRSIVARSKTRGKTENSRGLRTLIDIITTTSPAMMLNVKRTSSAIDGSGTTSIAIMAKMTSGIAIPFASVKISECRKSDTNVLDIITFIINYIRKYFMNFVKLPFKLIFVKQSACQNIVIGLEKAIKIRNKLSIGHLIQSRKAANTQKVKKRA
jgi:hypothetical protein